MKTTLSNDSESQTPAGGQFARWAAGAVVIAVIGVIVLVCWRIYVGIHGASAPPGPVTDTVPPLLPIKQDNAQANWSPASFTAKAADGLRQTSDSSWSVKGGRAFMQVRRLNDGSLELRFVYPFDGWLPEETIALLRTRWSLGPTEPLVEQLKITPEQLAQLMAVSPATDIPVSTADREELHALFNDYLAATDKPAAEKALVAAVVALDVKYYDRTMQLVESIATEVKQIFTEEQRAGLLRRFGNSPPANRTGER
jgi:hypothetical protein